jgi:hypothetical protein
MRLLPLFAAVTALGMALAAPAGGELLCDYLGYDYTEPLARDFTTPGQHYLGLGFVDNILVPNDPLTCEYTFLLTSGTLTSADSFAVGPFQFAEYKYQNGDGHFFVYGDTLASGTPGDYGINPPNATAPSTFEDGVLFLGADFDSLTVLVNLTNWTASLSGTLVFYCGEEWEGLPCYAGWTFAGETIGPGSPEGYIWEIDGQVFVEEISTEESSWGEVKKLFR